MQEQSASEFALPCKQDLQAAAKLLVAKLLSDTGAGLADGGKIALIS
jgi:hypothetical protein